MLFSRVNPFHTSLSVPNVVEIIERTMVLGSCDRKARVASDADLYLCPPVGHFRTLEVTSFDQILEAGYCYAQKEIQAWQDTRAQQLKP